MVMSTKENCETSATNNSILYHDECVAGTSKMLAQTHKCNLQCNPSSTHPISHGSSAIAVGRLKDVDDFEVLETLGKGFFGIAYKVREKKYGKFGQTAPILVMKEPIIHNAKSGFAKKIVCDEYQMLRHLRHPNILKTKGICLKKREAEWKLNLLVDFCDSGSLQHAILNSQRPFSWQERCSIGLDVCKAMDFVHRQGFMHRDLTSMNVLLQSSPNSPFPRGIVADFGLSCRIPSRSEMKQQVGTQNWMAPEMLMEQFYNEKADVFSFGIIVCQLIARIDSDHDAGLYRTPMFGLDYVRFTAHCPSDTPLNLLKTAFMCCLWNSESRPSFESLIPRIRQIISDDLPKWVDLQTSAEDGRMGRSYSDTTIRRHPSSLLGRRLDGFRPDSLAIPEGASLDVCSIDTPISSVDEMDTRIKELATTVANQDPDYQESTMNPFSNHDRYRSIRKIKPGDFVFLRTARADNEESGSKIGDAESKEDAKGVSSISQTRRRRSASMPSIVLSPPSATSTGGSPLMNTSKRSVTLGLGEQRELQGRITMTFRDYDQKFATSRSGILHSVKDLTQTSDDSLESPDIPDGFVDDDFDCDSEENEDVYIENSSTDDRFAEFVESSPVTDSSSAMGFYNNAKELSVSNGMSSGTPFYDENVTESRKSSARRGRRSRFSEDGQCHIL